MSQDLAGDAPTGTAGRLRLRYTALSDVGRVRKDNQDSGYAGEHFLAIADGVGGAARGDVRQQCRDRRAAHARRTRRATTCTPPLAEAIDRAHDKLAELVEQHPELDGTSTTVTAAIFDGTRLGVGHVGDSRGYLLRDGVISQITTDHTFVQSLVDEGRITEEESRVHPHRSLILRAVDGVHEPEPDQFYVDLALGDRRAALLRRRQRLPRQPADRRGPRPGHGRARRGRAGPRGARPGQLRQRHRRDRRRGRRRRRGPEETAPVAIGPLVVGAARREAPRPGSIGGRKLRAMRRSDTGELDPVPADEGTPGRPRGAPLRPAPPAPLRLAASYGGARGDRRAALPRRLGGLRVDPEAVLRGARRRHRRDLPRGPGPGAGHRRCTASTRPARSRSPTCPTSPSARCATGSAPATSRTPATSWPG